MKKNKKFATIDIGSNAIRLLISNVYKRDSKFFTTKNSLIRLPVRLGQDAFKNGKISKTNITRLFDSLKSFQLIMKVHNVEKYLAYATSALRSSSNGELIVNEVSNKIGLNVEIISGSKEAKIITNNNKFFSNENTYCFLDVGGGSTELTLFKNNKIISSRSFKIGGVRLINNMVKSFTWKKLEEWIYDNLGSQKDIKLVGLGGNINKIFKISGNNIGVPLKKSLLDISINKLDKMTDFEKTIKLKLNPDRIDVIVPAGKIYQFVMDKLNSKEILVPKIGLADAMVHELLKKS
ncbi:MAG: exopolyphosphatase [Flavobacteriales bacterium]|nr:MAG: exopolyphosphatase [Flavobacteriales bacterium]